MQYIIKEINRYKILFDNYKINDEIECIVYFICCYKLTKCLYIVCKLKKSHSFADCIDLVIVFFYRCNPQTGLGFPKVNCSVE